MPDLDAYKHELFTEAFAYDFDEIDEFVAELQEIDTLEQLRAHPTALPRFRELQ